MVLLFGSLVLNYYYFCYTMDFHELVNLRSFFMTHAILVLCRRTPAPQKVQSIAHSRPSRYDDRTKQRKYSQKIITIPKKSLFDVFPPTYLPSCHIIVENPPKCLQTAPICHPSYFSQAPQSTVHTVSATNNNLASTTITISSGAHSTNNSINTPQSQQTTQSLQNVQSQPQISVAPTSMLQQQLQEPSQVANHKASVNNTFVNSLSNLSNSVPQLDHSQANLLVSTTQASLSMVSAMQQHSVPIGPSSGGSMMNNMLNQQIPAQMVQKPPLPAQSLSHSMSQFVDPLESSLASLEQNSLKQELGMSLMPDMLLKQENNLNNLNNLNNMNNFHGMLPQPHFTMDMLSHLQGVQGGHMGHNNGFQPDYNGGNGQNGLAGFGGINSMQMLMTQMTGQMYDPVTSLADNMRRSQSYPSANSGKNL